jgi:predicted glycosyltransferase
MNPPHRGRVFFYVQHLLGVGHQARAAAITRALQRQGMHVIYVSGGFAETRHDLGGAEFIQLPPVRAADATFGTMIDASGQPIDAAWENHRRDALLAAFRNAQPDALLIESFPFGRRRFRFELLPLLETATKHVPVAASVRDILVAKKDPKRTQWIVDTVREFFNMVIVHGDPQITELGDSFDGAAAFSERIQYSGYVAPPAMRDFDEERSGVVVSAGGGAVGGPLLHGSLAARPLSRLSRAHWRLITGPNLPKSDREALKLPPGVTVDTYRKDFRSILCNVALSVSQAGYNTVMDLFTTRTRSVLVPFSRHGETEQSHRAALLSRRGGFQVVAENNLTPTVLAAAIDAAIDAPPPDPSKIDLNGATRTAELMAELATGRPFPSRL